MSGKEEPVIQRSVANVVAPPVHGLEVADFFTGEVPDLEVLKAHLLKEGRLEYDAAYKLIDTCAAIFKSEPNLLVLQYPLTVCGDIHGQFFDMKKLLEMGGDPASTKYLFLGDYVDRGCFSTEVVFFLFALKIIYPKTVYMLRGNHECRQLTSFFNFKDECVYKYNEELYNKIMSAFDNLPLAATVEKTFFCVHGGLSPDLVELKEIQDINRFRETPREGPMCDLLWSDPFDESNSDASGDGWYEYNATRQCSYIYGAEAVKKFNRDNKITAIIRAHEAQAEGYKMHMVNKRSQIPRVITIFSAPNYCDVYNNKAVVLKLDHNVLNIKQFQETPHPYYLPNFMDVFQWSMPFVAEKVTDMLDKVLAMEDDDSDEEDTGMTAERREHLKNKVKSVSKMLKMYKMLRQNNEAIVTLKQLTPNNRIPFGLLAQGTEAIEEAVAGFDNAKSADKTNEALPGVEFVSDGARQSLGEIVLPPPLRPDGGDVEGVAEEDEEEDEE
jgi:serine/threonine-protein phosphatase 2B catalytic subunit